MRRVSNYAIVLVLCIASSIAYAGTERAEDPYSVSATVSTGHQSMYTVRVTVTEKATGAVVFAPAVSAQANVGAEAFSDPRDGKPQFNVAIVVNASGKAVVTFKAYERLLQRSVISAD
jgi:outer membrane protein assembly factor BamB